MTMCNSLYNQRIRLVLPPVEVKYILEPPEDLTAAL